MSFMLLGILNAQAAGGGGGAFDLLETTTLTSSASSITFSGIDQSYKHLQIRSVARGVDGGNIKATFNGDAGSNYAAHGLYGTGSAVASFASLSRSNVIVAEAGTNTNVFYASVTDIVDYSSTTKYKTIKGLMGSTLILLRSGVWMNTSAITSINLSCQTNDFTAGTRISIYGIKGA